MTCGAGACLREHRDRNLVAPPRHLRIGILLGRCGPTSRALGPQGGARTLRPGGGVWGATMTDSLEAAKQMVEKLIAIGQPGASRRHVELRAHQRGGQHRGEIAVRGAQILRIHPCWLRYVVAQGEFKSCVADEIEAWHLLEQLTGPVPTPAEAAPRPGATGTPAAPTRTAPAAPPAPPTPRTSRAHHRRVGSRPSRDTHLRAPSGRGSTAARDGTTSGATWPPRR